MTDLCVYQFGDNVWDDFCLSEDSMENYPNPCSLKKRLRQKNNYGDETDDSSFVSLSKKRDIMSHISDGNAATMLSQAFEIDDIKKGSKRDKANAVVNNSFSYSLDDITDPVDNLDFFENTECEDSGGYLCYGLPELGNFEDAFGMFRTCDSTFGPIRNVGGSDELVQLNLESLHPELNLTDDILVSNDSAKNDSFTSFVDGNVMDTEDGFIPREENFRSFKGRYEEEASIPSPCSYLQSSLTFTGSDKIHCSNVAAIDQLKDGLRSGDRGFNPRSPIDSSVTSIHSKNIESSDDPQCENLSTKGNFCSIRKQMLFSGYEKGLSMNHAVDDDTSFEASSFHQLQHVMNKLDSRTKLCIRDSLYRLSRSAERRHNDAKSNIQLGYDNETSASFLPKEASSCLLSIEKDTNPVDRSIADLLFHRPLSSPVLDHTLNLPSMASCC